MGNQVDSVLAERALGSARSMRAIEPIPVTP